ncbi:hypothetical protein [Kutzneria chonburiensis]|uniref:hypothetical protein n=1 Tax=Kutzneria chonburiensis TaxID=1483604 RepID=UPI00236175EF|nr:hypothetical protein [Kutzneria chonburiensis]
MGGGVCCCGPGVGGCWIGRFGNCGDEVAAGGVGGCCCGCCGRTGGWVPTVVSATSSRMAIISPLSDRTRSMIVWGDVSDGSSARRRRRLGALSSELAPYWASNSATVR